MDALDEKTEAASSSCRTTEKPPSSSSSCGSRNDREDDCRFDDGLVLGLTGALVGGGCGPRDGRVPPTLLGRLLLLEEENES